MLQTLPEEVLVNIVSWLYPLDEALAAIPCVCRAWRSSLDGNRERFWRGLAAEKGVKLPHISGRSTRLSMDPKRAFMKRRRDVAAAGIVAADRAVWKIWLRLHSSDCAALVRNVITQRSDRSISVDHRLHFFGNRTLLMLACWRGRTKVVAELLGAGASIHNMDDRGATPLLMASWAGHAHVIRILLLRNDKSSMMLKLLNQKGVPPMSSSCGGRGPKTAICWAYRKGFQDVVRLLELAGANIGHYGTNMD